MRYVDAGYVIALSVLAAYALALLLRRRRLVRAAGLAARQSAEGTVAGEQAPAAAAAPGAAGEHLRR